MFLFKNFEKKVVGDGLIETRKKESLQMIETAQGLSDVQRGELEKMVTEGGQTPEGIQTLIRSYQAGESSPTYYNDAIAPLGKKGAGPMGFASGPAAWRKSLRRTIEEPEPVVPVELPVRKLKRVFPDDEVKLQVEDKSKKIDGVRNDAEIEEAVDTNHPPVLEVNTFSDRILAAQTFDALRQLFPDTAEYIFEDKTELDITWTGLQIKDAITKVEKGESFLVPKYWDALARKLDELKQARPENGKSAARRIGVEVEPSPVVKSLMYTDLDSFSSSEEKSPEQLDQERLEKNEEILSRYDLNSAKAKNLPRLLESGDPYLKKINPDGLVKDLEANGVPLLSEVETATERTFTQKIKSTGNVNELIGVVSTINEIRGTTDDHVYSGADMAQRIQGVWDRFQKGERDPSDPLDPFSAAMVTRRYGIRDKLLDFINPAQTEVPKEEKKESTEDWETFRKTFWDQVEGTKTFDELYVLIRKVEQGFTDDAGNLALSAGSLIGNIDSFRNGNTEHFTSMIPESFRPDVLRLKQLEETPALERTISLTRSAAETVEGVTQQEQDASPEAVEQARQAMILAQKEYHDALRVQLLATKHGFNDEGNDLAVLKCKRLYTEALGVYAQLEANQRIEAYRKAHLGEYRADDLSKSQLVAIARDPECRLLSLSNEYGIIPQDVADLLLRKGILTDVDTARTVENKYPLEEQGIRADVFNEVLLQDYARRSKAFVALENQPEGVRGRYEKFQQWFQKLPKEKKWLYGLAACVGTGALVSTATVLGLGAIGVAVAGGMKVGVGALAGAAAGRVGGKFTGAGKFEKVAAEMDAKTAQEVADISYQVATNGASVESGLDASVNVQRQAYIEKSQKRLDMMRRSMDFGTLSGAAFGAACGWFFEYTPAGQKISASIQNGWEQLWDRLFGNGQTQINVAPQTTSQTITQPSIPTGNPSPISNFQANQILNQPSGNLVLPSQPLAPQINPMEALWNSLAGNSSAENIFRGTHGTPFDAAAPLDNIKMEIIKLIGHSQNPDLFVQQGGQLISLDPSITVAMNNMAGGVDAGVRSVTGSAGGYEQVFNAIRSLNLANANPQDIVAVLRR